ncbi:acyltransferase [Ahrensia sp. 13_GOM-1096m]|uniref:acyltransferase family protein n=1 Tax=Ahrensia sp. 13_GOM-1096m TaxID=1380380 RepID=UPI00068685A0|nr:acyltransferase [Ahrensia sp. 13_GOM-1096m]
MEESSLRKTALPVFHSFAMWRFIAALLIMTYHFMHYSENSEVWVRWFENMLPLLDMFFMMSGYLIYDRYREKLTDTGEFGSFLFKRLAKLYPLHMITTGFFVFVGLAWQLGFITSNAGVLRYDWTSLPSNILLLQAWGTLDTLTFNYVSWSLSAEWFCYLMMPLILFVALRSGIVGLLVVAAIFYMGTEYAISQDWPLGKTIADTKTWGAYRAFASFAIGAAVVQLVDMRIVLVRSHCWGWAVMGITIIAMFLSVNFYLIIAMMALALVLSAIAEHENPQGLAWMRPILPVLAVSFGIYLWHPVVETVMLSFIWRHYLGDIAPFAIEWFMLLAGVMSIAVALASHHFYEKPLGNWLVGHFERKTALKMQNKSA